MTGKKNKIIVSLATLFFICAIVFNQKVVFAENENIKLKIDKVDLKEGVSVELMLSIIDEENIENDDIFIKTNISHEQIYLGEKFAIVYELYSTDTIKNYRFIEEISIDNTITEHISEEKLSDGLVNLNGKEYKKYEIEKIFISPIKEGILSVPPYKLKIDTAQGDDGSGGKSIYLQTKGVEIDVLSLPIDGMPDDFSGIVGNLNITSEYSENEITYNDSLTLKVTIEGNCNLVNVKEIVKIKPDGFSVYENEVNFNENVVDNMYTSKKEFEVIFVPEKTGKLTIEPIQISYFDTALGEYMYEEINGVDIAVKGNINDEQSSNQESSNTLEKVVINQVSYDIPKEGYLSINIKKKHIWSTLVLVVSISVLITGLIYIIVKNKKDIKLNEIYKKLNKTKDLNDIYNEFNEMIKYKFGINIKSSSKSVILQSIADEELNSIVIEIIDTIENNEKVDIKNLKYKIRIFYRKCMRM